MSILTDVYTNVYSGVVVALSRTETPAPIPGFGGDENLVTPTWVGFAMTFLIALATVFLVLDMTKRIRRTRYREEIRAQLAAEAATAAAGKPAAAGAGADAGAAAGKPTDTQ